jgi:hypothetical protein
MSKLSGFARIPRAEFLFPDCQTCYFHNREPAICEDCDNGDEYQPADDLDDKLSGRKAGIVRFYRRAGMAPAADTVPENEEELEAA